MLVCKSKFQLVRLISIVSHQNRKLLLQIWEKSFYNGVKCVKTNSIRREIGKKAKDSQRCNCCLLFVKVNSIPESSLFDI